MEIEIIEGDTSDIDHKKTSNRLTKFEYTMLISARALQITAGSKPLIPYQEEGIYDPREIAKLELLSRVIPLVIQRTLPNGDKEAWHVKDMYIKDY